MKLKSKFVVIFALCAVFCIATLLVSCGKKGDSSGSDSANHADCDHKTLNPVFLTGEDLGICSGALFAVMTCECGEYKLLDTSDEDYFNIACEIDNVSESGVNESGNQYYKFIDTCKVCGAKIEGYSEHGRSECGYETKGYLKITQNNVVTLDAKFDSVEHGPFTSNYETKKVNIADLTDKNVCGGYIEIKECRGCGEIIAIDYENIACKGLFDKEPVKKEYVDEAGVKHGEEHLECDDCGLKLLGDMEVNHLSDCISYVKSIEKIIVDGKTVNKHVGNEGFEGEHEDDYSYKIVGKTCLDGVKITRDCKKCNYKYSYTRNGHVSDNNRKEIIVSEACDDRIYVEYCQVCGELAELNYNNSLVHSFETVEDKTYTDENGIEHSFTHKKCTRCGMERSVDEYRIVSNESPCEGYDYKTTTVIAQNKTVYTCKDRDYNSTHNYKSSAKLKEGSTSCEDGIIVTATCDICGDSYQYTARGHYIKEEEIELNAGTCSGMLTISRCTCCGEITNLYINFGSHVIETVEDKTYADENGIEHRYHRNKCSECGLEESSDEYKIQHEDSPCEYTVYSVKTVTFAGKTYVYNQKYYSSFHNFEYTAKLKKGSTSCADGIIIKEVCSVCGMVNEWERTGHYIESEIIDLPESPCGGRISIDRCIVCKEVTFFDGPSGDHLFETKENGTYTDENGFEHTYSYEKCLKCGIEIRDDWYKVPSAENPCELTNRGTRTITSADKTINYSGSYTHYTSDHKIIYSFKLNGETCDDGWTAYGVCAICGESSGQISGYGHESYIVGYCDLAEYGACGGDYIETRSCACGLFKSINFYHNNEVNSEYVDMLLEEGEYRHYKEIVTCDNCELRIEKEVIGVRAVDEATQTEYVNYTETWTVSVGNTIILQDTAHYREDSVE